MATPAGTLNVAQLRQIILLHEGKSEDHDGPMEVRQIAQRFRVEAEEIQKILQFVSLPQENDNKDWLSNNTLSNKDMAREGLLKFLKPEIC